MLIEDVKILIVEDQEVIAENLRRILLRLGANNTKVACVPEEAIALCRTIEFDLLLMDINLGKNEISGIDLCEKLYSKIKPHIYITANADSKTVKTASKTNPLGYIVKPFTKDAIYASIEIVLSKIGSEKLTLIDKGKKVSIPLEEVHLIKADGNYLEFHLKNGKTLMERNTIKNISESLSSRFIQVHRSFIVNKFSVNSYSSTQITVNDQLVPLGRSFKDEFYSKIERG